ncbi:MAG TPA: 2-phospho-L-lactate transferase [Anaerolineaceae bacterium]|nr:MAG: 2-phospho-L-lactate transferase [Anaerolineae bacterium 49_20]HAE85177.1 2-phospho-L-lactate transferase [Anaerolineaceae bacterium]
MIDVKARKVVALAGGVGGAKLALGLQLALSPGNLTVIVNTGDDFEHFGLAISPDVDTVCYTLAGKVDIEKGWGLQGESWNVLTALKALSAPTWFQLGDRDLATHMERTRLLQAGWSLSQITEHFCRLWGVSSHVLPMSDQPFRTLIRTQAGELLAFQEYFVREHCEPSVAEIIFQHAEGISPAPQVLSSIEAADLVVICPSNPWVSIDPILALTGIVPALKMKPVIAVSPIIQGKTVKGPAAKMAQELGLEASAAAVLGHYTDFVNGFIYDQLDGDIFTSDNYPGIIKKTTNTIMKNDEDKLGLAIETLKLGERLLENTQNND